MPLCLIPPGRGDIYAACSVAANDRLPYTRGPHICGPYNSAAMERSSCGARLGRDKSIPYEYCSPKDTPMPKLIDCINQSLGVLLIGCFNRLKPRNQFVYLFAKPCLFLIRQTQLAAK